MVATGSSCCSVVGQRLAVPKDTETVPMRGHTAPRCSVTNSTLPAAVTAASSATASPPRPEEALGGPPGRPSMPTPTADGQTCR